MQPTPPPTSGEPAREIEVEVLPPALAATDSPLLRFIAVLMDDLFLIPGTRMRVGLDPILGLFPGFGDTSANVISAVALLETARRGLPKIVLAHMALNILVNTLFGAIPVLGDAFSVWFKSNKRNYELLVKYSQATRPPSTVADWAFVGLLIGGLIAIILVVAGITFFIVAQLFGLLVSLFS